MSEVFHGSKAVIVHVHTVCWNEREIMPYFLRHYSTFADKIFVHDQGSDDGTKEIVKSCPKAVYMPVKFKGIASMKSNAWFVSAYKKYSRGVADWVMCVDADEFLYCPNLLERLQTAKDNGVKIMKTSGFEMGSICFPTTSGQIYDEVKTGVRYWVYGKHVIFSPECDVTFSFGLHSTQSVEPIPHVHYGFWLLHFRFLSKVYMLARSLKNIAGIKIVAPEDRMDCFRMPDHKLEDWIVERDLMRYHEVLRTMRIIL